MAKKSNPVRSGEKPLDILEIEGDEEVTQKHDCSEGGGLNDGQGERLPAEDSQRDNRIRRKPCLDHDEEDQDGHANAERCQGARRAPGVGIGADDPVDHECCARGHGQKELEADAAPAQAS